MNRMVKNLMVVLMAALMFFTSALTPVHAESASEEPAETQTEVTDGNGTTETVGGDPAENKQTETTGDVDADPTETVGTEPTEPAGQDTLELAEDGNQDINPVDAPVDGTAEEESAADSDEVEAAEVDQIFGPAMLGKNLSSGPAGLLAEPTRGDDDTVPKISKTLGDNGDGTYTIGLSVTGDALTTATSSPVNVVIVYDVSTSMTGNLIPSETGSMGINYYDDFDGVSDGDYFRLYKNVNGSYSAVTDAENYAGTVYRRTRNWNGSYTYSVYTGQRHHGSITRADAGEKVVYDFTKALFGYQDSTDPSNIQAALVTFSRTATATQGWTSTEADITKRVSNTGTSHSLSYSGYTNWEAAMWRALQLVNSADDDPTYVVFITDGQPTESNYSNQYTGTNVSGNAGNDDYRRALNEARLVEQAVDAKKGALYSIYAYGKAADWLASLTYYAYNGSRPASGTEGTTFDTEGYYNASDTAALTNAINEIFSKIVDTLGVGSASIDDGTTNAVQTTSGEIAELLEVDTSSYKYWLKIPVVGSGNTYTFSMVDKATGDPVDYTASVSGENVTITWNGGANSATYKGKVNAGSLELEWVDKTAFYNYDAPGATFNPDTGAVDWDLKSVGTLLNGVTYTVTFECYPSQYTLDLIADLKNGYIEYDKVDANIRKYLTEDYKLATNTTAVLTYTDTRNDDGEQTKTYTNPEPEDLSAAKQLLVSKKWSNTLDNRDNWKTATIDLLVTRDGEERYTVKLNDGNDWTDDVFISYGILTSHDDTLTLKTTGHDYSFAETAEVGHNWEIEAPTVRPMLINTVGTMLVKIEESEAPEELTSSTKENYTVTNGDGTYYKLTIENDTGEKNIEYYIVDDAAGSLTATNHRRSYLDVVKQVTGNVPDNTEFEFKMTVKTNAEDADPENTASDAWVWFSIWDTSKNEAVKNPDAATANGLKWEIGEGDNAEVVDTKPAVSAFNGYFLVPTGNEITVAMKAGYSLRFLNLPVGAEYTITETDTENDNASFASITGERGFDADGDKETDDWTTESAGTVSGQSISGSIQYAESAYKVEVTNTADAFYVYHSSDKTIEKIMGDDPRLTYDAQSKSYTFNIVHETKSNHLYGGYFSAYKGAGMTDSAIIAATYSDSDSKSYTYDADKTNTTTNWFTDSDGTVYDGKTASQWNKKNAYTEVNGLAMHPEANKVYYLKEVPDQFFRPALYYVYDTRAENKPLKKLYLMVPTDDNLYQLVCGRPINIELSKKLYSTFKVENANGTKTTIKVNNINSNLTRGYLTIWDAAKFMIAGEVYEWTPNYVTLDGVEVTSCVTRTISMGDLCYGDKETNFDVQDEKLSSVAALYEAE